jgi:hypothetical protein
MTVIQCSVAQVPPVGLHTRLEVSDPFTGVGLYSPDLATLEATHPGWAETTFDDSMFEPCYTYYSLPAPWGIPSVGSGAAWMSDPYVKTHGFVTGENWAGRWRWFPTFSGIIISAHLVVECTDILEVVRFNGIDITDGVVPPSLIEHSGGDGNVVATYMQSDVLDPYAAIAWGLVMEIVVIPGYWPHIRATVPPAEHLRLTHHA